MDVELTSVLLRDPTLTPGEILMSESQERMMAVVTPGELDAFVAVMDKWDVEYSGLGEVTDTGRLIITWHGETIVDVDPRTVAHEGPVYDRPFARPDGRTPSRPTTTGRAAGRPADREELRAAAAASSSPRRTCAPRPGSPTSTTATSAATPRWPCPDDAGVVRVDEETGLGVALATDANGRYTYLDPYHGAQLALAEAYRNVATSGAVPLAVTDCLNFGSPEDPDVMWQLAEAIRGLSDGCMELGIPVTGGNVSLYNQTGDVADPPDAGGRRARHARRRRPPHAVGLARRRPGDLPAGHDRATSWTARNGPPCAATSAGCRRRWTSRPRRALGEILINASRDGMVDAAHDLSEGGLAQALVESCLRYGVGARIGLEEVCERDGVDPFTALFSESTAAPSSRCRAPRRSASRTCARRGASRSPASASSTTGIRASPRSTSRASSR